MDGLLRLPRLVRIVRLLRCLMILQGFKGTLQRIFTKLYTESLGIFLSVSAVGLRCLDPTSFLAMDSSA